MSSFQNRVADWADICFADHPPLSPESANVRFIEEALELVQAGGCPKEVVHQYVDYVYSRPVGDKPQEVAGVLITLARFCSANNLDMMQCGEQELNRIWANISVIRSKDAVKPDFLGEHNARSQ